MSEFDEVPCVVREGNAKNFSRRSGSINRPKLKMCCGDKERHVAGFDMHFAGQALSRHTYGGHHGGLKHIVTAVVVVVVVVVVAVVLVLVVV